MAKSQKRSTRELKKPKKNKDAAGAASPSPFKGSTIPPKKK
ncbi:MAG: hypothetical protein JWM77_3523 [Rhodospirillales bacterium]|nr:hypothetical protein [Rhodospirillales bacterium]